MICEHGTLKIMAAKKTTLNELGEMLAHVVEHVATKDDVRAIVRGELQPINDRLVSVENKLTGLYRMHEAEGMKVTDLKLPRRLHDLEEEVYGVGQAKHPKHMPL